MIRAAAGLLGNPTVRFVGLSIGLHMGLLWLADAVAGRTLITTLPQSACRVRGGLTHGSAIPLIKPGSAVQTNETTSLLTE